MAGFLEERVNRAARGTTDHCFDLWQKQIVPVCLTCIRAMRGNSVEVEVEVEVHDSMGPRRRTPRTKDEMRGPQAWEVSFPRHVRPYSGCTCTI